MGNRRGLGYRRELGRAHIALNQFYGFSPAVFGAEALAAGCAVMMSSDEFVETDLPAGSNECWVVTKHHQVYSHLRRLLDDLKSPIAKVGDVVRKAKAEVGTKKD